MTICEGITQQRELLPADVLDAARGKVRLVATGAAGEKSRVFASAYLLANGSAHVPIGGSRAKTRYGLNVIV